MAIGVADGSLKLELPKQRMGVVYDICQKCLEINPENRPNFQEIVSKKKLIINLK